MKPMLFIPQRPKLWIWLSVALLCVPATGFPQRLDPAAEARISELRREVDQLKSRLRTAESRAETCRRENQRLAQEVATARRDLSGQEARLRQFTMTEQGQEAQRAYQVQTLTDRLRNLQDQNALKALSAGLPSIDGGVTCEELLTMVQRIGPVPGLRGVLTANTSSLIYPVNSYCLDSLALELGDSGPGVAEAVRKAGPISEGP